MNIISTVQNSFRGRTFTSN